MNDYKIRIEDREYELSNADLARLDLVKTAANEYHLLHDGKAYSCQLLSLELDSKTMTVRVNGRKHVVELRDRVDQLVDQLGLSVEVATSSTDVFAPMPGLILDIMVQEGDEIAAGTPLLILEAMKMENMLKAEGPGKVMKIAASQGDAVEKRQLLIEIAPLS